MHHLYALLARIGLASIFISAGWSSLGAQAGTQPSIDATGISPALLPLVILLGIGAGVAVLTGLFTRSGAVLLAAFPVAAAVLSHADLGDTSQSIHLMKNLAIAGGLLLLAAHGAGDFSIDAWRRARRSTHVPTTQGGAL